MKSWVTELFAGMLLATVAQPIRSPCLQVAAGLTVSLAYEYTIDSNRGNPSHHPVGDMAQRGVGIVVGVSIWRILRGGKP